MNYLIRWRDVDDYKADDIYDQSLGLLAEFDAGELKQPLQVPLNVHLR